MIQLLILCAPRKKNLINSWCCASLVDKFQEKDESGQTGAKGQDHKGGRNIPQRQRLVMSRTLLILHFTLVNLRLNCKILDAITNPSNFKANVPHISCNCSR